MKLIPLTGKGNENLYRHPDTGIIYFSKYRAGKGKIEKSTKTRVLAEAKVIADEIRVKFFGKGVIKRGKQTCGVLFPGWQDLNKTKAPATVASIESSWKHLKPYIQDFLPEEITERFWEGVYIPEKRLTHGQDRKFFNDRKWLSMFLLFLKREGVIDAVPKLRNPDPECKVGKVYTDDELQRLLQNAGPDLKLQILMAVSMGMRKSEIMKLTWARIDMANRVIHLRAEDTKIRKARSFAISAVVYRLLELRDRSKAFLFPSPLNPNKPQVNGIERAWQRCKRAAKVIGRFHDLRHTFLTRAFRSKNVNPALICFYAGLSLIEAQDRYLHFTIDDTREVVTAMRENWGKLD